MDWDRIDSAWWPALHGYLWYNNADGFCVRMKMTVYDSTGAHPFYHYSVCPSDNRADDEYVNWVPYHNATITYVRVYMQRKVDIPDGVFVTVGSGISLWAPY